MIDYIKIVNDAKKKQERIIKLYGDENGKRKGEKYLNKLINEAVELLNLQEEMERSYKNARI